MGNNNTPVLRRVNELVMRAGHRNEDKSLALQPADDVTAVAQYGRPYRTNSRIARSSPSKVSGYMRSAMSWRIMRIDWV